MVQSYSVCPPPGGKFSRRLYHFWTFWVKAYIMIAGDLLVQMFWRTPKIDLTVKRTGQVCVLTGANGAIGQEIMKILLNLDYFVFVGVRDTALMQKHVNKIREEGICSGNVKILELDLKRLHSVKTFAEQVLSCPEARNIHLLMNNAGIYQYGYEVTPDNLEAHFQVQYLSHFYLTNLLLPRIKQTAQENRSTFCHIVNTASILHYGGNLIFDNLAQTTCYVPMQCYFDSKLCKVLHAKIIQAQLNEEGYDNILMYATHPGSIFTHIYRDSGWVKGILKHLMPLMSRNEEGGAHMILYAALTPSILETCGGKYFENGKAVQPNRQADDPEIRQKLWNMSNEIVGNIVK